MTVVETPLFLRKAEKILDEEERAALVLSVGTEPEAGEIIPETGGIRKLRWALEGRGKSSGARVIYYFHSDRMPVVLLSIYAKSVKVNLSRAERNELKKLIPELVRVLKEGDHERLTAYRVSQKQLGAEGSIEIGDGHASRVAGIMHFNTGEARVIERLL